MNERVTPEEKLLKLIKGDKKDLKVPGQDVRSSGKTQSASGDNKNKSSKQGINLFHGFGVKKLKGVNCEKTLLVALFISIFYFLGVLIYPIFSGKEISLPVSGVKIEEFENQGQSKIQPFDVYFNDLRSKKVFAGPGQGEYGQIEAGVNVLSGAELLKDISLIGVISGENPQAIIEDKRTQKTYYVNVGQFIEKFQVEQILEGKIILNYQGERFELSI